MMRRMPRLIVAAALAASLGVITSAQQPQQPPAPPPDQPIFRSSTRLIVTTVAVKDKDGKPIEGLTAQDFVVTEDGQPQDIAFVEFQRLATEAAPALQANVAPATPAPAAPAQPEVAAVTQAVFTPPAAGDTKYRDKRLLIIYFDLSAMQIGDQLRAYQAAIKYVTSQMTSSDLMAVMTYEGGAVRIKQDFTADRAVVRNVIDVLMYGEDKDGDGVRDEPDQSSAFGQGDAEFNIFNTDRQLAALQTAVTMLRPFPEQKALVYFGSGLRLNGNDNTAQLRATTNAAVRANVTINPVDARGLVALSPLGDATQRSPGGQAMFTGQLAMSAMNGFQRSQDTLFSLAKDTGGTAMFDNNDLSAGIVQAAQAMSSYYIIGFYSTHPANDGKFRRVKVSLANGKEGELAYRQGYFADKEWARQNGVERERQLEEALMLDNPVTDITIAMELNFFQLNRAEYFVPVHVKIPGSELALARRRGAQRTLLDFIGEVKDNYGITIQNVRDKLDIPISDKTATELSARPIQYETGFTLLPGQYVIKFLARDAEAGRLGTYQTSFTIPNLNREEVRLPISSVVLSSQRVPFGEELHTVKNSLSTQAQANNPLVFQGEKLVPSVTRVFSTTKDLYVLLQAYERGATETAPLVAFVTLYKGDVKAFETQPIQVTDGLDAKSKAVPLRFSIPLQGIAPGRYECQVTVLEPGGRKAAFWRAPVVLIP